MFCSFAILLSKVIKVMNVYFELTPVRVKYQLIQALSVMTISNVSHSFYKNLGNTFLKSYNWQDVHLPGDKRWMRIIELNFEMSLSDCTGHSAITQLQSYSPAPPQCSQVQFYPTLSLFGTYQKKGKDMGFYIFLNVFMK